MIFFYNFLGMRQGGEGEGEGGSGSYVAQKWKITFYHFPLP